MFFVCAADKNILDLHTTLDSEIAKYLTVADRRIDVLRGNFFDGGKATWNTPKFKLCCYLSSTTSDTNLERDVIINDLLFSLREIAKPHGKHRDLIRC